MRLAVAKAALPPGQRIAAVSAPSASSAAAPGVNLPAQDDIEAAENEFELRSRQLSDTLSE